MVEVENMELGVDAAPVLGRDVIFSSFFSKKRSLYEFKIVKMCTSKV